MSHFRKLILKQCSVVILPISFCISIFLSYVNWKYTKGPILLALDLYLIMAISFFGIFEYFKYKRYRSVLLLITVFLGLSQINRLIGVGEFNSILIAWVPPTIVLASFLYGIRYAIMFLGLYMLLPIIIYLLTHYSLVPEFMKFVQPPKQSVFFSLVGAMVLSFGYSFVFEGYRKLIQVAIKKQSQVETEERFFATLSHEVNNPITIAILALNQDSLDDDDPSKNRILANLMELSKRSQQYDGRD